MDNGRFNELFSRTGEMGADIENIKDDVKYLLTSTNALKSELIKFRTTAGVIGGGVSLVVSVMVLIARAFL